MESVSFCVGHSRLSIIGNYETGFPQAEVTHRRESGGISKDQGVRITEEVPVETFPNLVHADEATDDRVVAASVEIV